MSSFYSVARSNYFRVKDEEIFRQECKRVGLDCWDSSAGEGVAIAPAGYYGWPNGFENDENGEFVDFDIVDFIQEHIADNQCCILMQVGHDELRYLVGVATAITKDQVKEIDLNSIYNLATEMVSSDVTLPEY